MDGFVEKKLLQVTESRKALLRIWFLSEKSLRNDLEVLYEELIPYFPQIDAIILNQSRKELLLSAQNFPKELISRLGKYQSIRVKIAKLSEVPAQIRQMQDNDEQVIVLYRKTGLPAVIGG